MLGRKVREQKGAWVRALERFNIVVTKVAAIKPAAQLLGTNRFVGSIMQTTMNQIESGKAWSTVEGAGTQG